MIPFPTVLDNPILIRELRRRMRGRALVYSMIGYICLITLIAVFIMLAKTPISTVDLQSSAASENFLTKLVECGQSIFKWITGIQTLLVLIIAPTITAGMTTGEKERKTFEFLQVTTIHPWAYILGSFFSTVFYAARGSARGNVSGTDQRHNMIYASTVDIEEAYRVGQKAVEIAATEGSGYMATILRQPGSIYNVYYDKVPLELVANSERSFPKGWISPDGSDVTDEFMAYARPLIGDNWPSIPLVDGRQRFAQLKPIMAEQKLPAYELQGVRVSKK